MSSYTLIVPVTIEKRIPGRDGAPDRTETRTITAFSRKPIRGATYFQHGDVNFLAQSTGGASFEVELDEVIESYLLGQIDDPDAALTAFASAADGTPDAASAPTSAANRLVDAANLQAVARLTRLVLLVPYAEAIVRVVYGSRGDGVTARAELVERFERELAACRGALDAPVALALTGLRDRCVDYLSRVITTLADVVPVSAPLALPSLWWAYRLYGDPLRAPELVARNGVPHPSFMPTAFEALAPQTRFSGQSS